MLAFKLFGSEMELRKADKSKSILPEQKDALKDEIKFLKQKIESNQVMRNDLMRQLDLLKEQRDELLFNFKNDLELEEQGTLDLLYNKHMLNLK